jgi:hypothetical protein
VADKKGQKDKDKSFLTSLRFYTFMFSTISDDTFVPFVFFVTIYKNIRGKHLNVIKRVMTKLKNRGQNLHFYGQNCSQSCPRPKRILFEDVYHK